MHLLGFPSLGEASLMSLAILHLNSVQSSHRPGRRPPDVLEFPQALPRAFPETAGGVPDAPGPSRADFAPFDAV